MKQVILCIEYFGEWVEDEYCWKWIGKSKKAIAIIVSTKVSFDELINEIIRRGELSCSHSDIVVKYVFSRVPEHYKVPPIVLKSDEDLKSYMLDVDNNGCRPTLKVSVVNKPLEVSSKVGENEQVGVQNDDFNFNNEDIDFFVDKSRVCGDLGGEEDTVEAVGHGHQNEYVDEDGEQISINTDIEINVPIDVEFPINTDDGEGVVCEEENNMVPYVDSEVATAANSQSSHVFSDRSDLRIGYLFDNKKEVVRKLKLVAVRGNFEFITKKSNSSVLTVACRDPNCKWWVHCRKFIESEIFFVSTYTSEHTCGLGHILGQHRQASADVIGQFVKNHFVEGKCPSPKEIQKYVRTELGCDVSYWKCWKGRQHAQN